MVEAWSEVGDIYYCIRCFARGDGGRGSVGLEVHISICTKFYSSSNSLLLTLQVLKMQSDDWGFVLLPALDIGLFYITFDAWYLCRVDDIY